MVKLKNNSGRVWECNLPHASFCGCGPCSCQTVRQPSIVHDPRTGNQATKELRRRVCASMTLLAGETRECGDNILRVPEVQAAVQRGELRVCKG